MHILIAFHYNYDFYLLLLFDESCRLRKQIHLCGFSRFVYVVSVSNNYKTQEIVIWNSKHILKVGSKKVNICLKTKWQLNFSCTNSSSVSFIHQIADKAYTNQLSRTKLMTISISPKIFSRSPLWLLILKTINISMFGKPIIPLIY